MCKRVSEPTVPWPKLAQYYCDHLVNFAKRAGHRELPDEEFGGTLIALDVTQRNRSWTVSVLASDSQGFGWFQKLWPLLATGLRSRNNQVSLVQIARVTEAE
jgi:hypothetical protein